MDIMWVSCLLVLWWCLASPVHGAVEERAPVVRTDARKSIASTEHGTISGVDVGKGTSNVYHLQFISMDPNSLFLPAILHSDMVFYVHTGSGTLSYSDDGRGDMQEVKLRRGDVYRLESGSIFSLRSGLEPERERLRINAIFPNADQHPLRGNSSRAYSSIHALFQGFDKTVLQAAFKVPEEVVEEVRNASKTPPIVHVERAESENRFVKVFLEMKNRMEGNKKTKAYSKTFNLFKEGRDVDNREGWSTMVTSKRLHALKGSDIGVFMVNLSMGAMMGPHWNPTATEIGVVLEGRGMVRVVCSSNLTTSPQCNSTRFQVEKGDVFIVPRFHPMAHMSFNNESLVFMGFSTSNTYNHPQFLAGGISVLHVLNKRILELAFSVNDTTISKVLDAQKGAIILDCTSCAEEELEIAIREEEERKRKKEEEEEQHRQEEERRRKKEEEEERQRQEEEEKRRREKEEEERQRQEEEKRRREKEEEQQQRQEEEEKRRRKEEEEEEEEEEERQREEERRRKKEEEVERQRQEEEEKEKRRRKKEAEEEEEEERRREEERRHDEDEKRRHEEEQRRQEEEERSKQKEEEEEERRQQEEEEERRQQEEEEERTRQEEEPDRRRHHGKGQEETEEEAARREEEERERQWEPPNLE